MINLTLISTINKSALLGDLDRNGNNNFDLIRFLAASLVIFSHSYLVTDSFSEEPLNHLVGFLNFGSLSVSVFFIVSGYLITKSVFRQQSLGRFVWARMLRIFPALTVCSIACALIAGPLLTSLSLSGYFQSLDVYKFGLGNATLLDMQSYLPGVFQWNLYPRTVNAPLWTLKAEILMYIVVFLVGVGNLYFSKHRNIRSELPLIIGVILYLVAMQLTLDYVIKSALQWIVFFVFGSMVYAFRDRIVLKRTYLSILWLLVIAFVLLKWPGYKVTVAVAITYSVFVFSYHPDLQIGQFSKYGDFSYGLYIYAFPIQQALIYFHSSMSPLIHFMVSYAVVLPIAILSWHFIEKPALGLKSAKLKGGCWPFAIRSESPDT